MQFGISTLSRSLYTSREAYLSVAQSAEQACFDFMSVNDHIIVPTNLGSAYPYTVGGGWSAAEQGHCFDQLVTISFLAGCTSQLRLLTSVMVVPYRPPIQTAKMLATIDVLSNGRLILGVGAGWMEEEFRALDAPFKERGAATDEYIEAYKALWTQDRPHYQGKFVSFNDIIFAPQPLQKPTPPIWIGGEGQAAMRRTIKLGTGWYPGNNNQRTLFDTPSRLANGVEKHRAMAEQADRDPATIDIGLNVQGAFKWKAHENNDGTARRMFTGSSEDMREDAEALAAIGVSNVALRLGGETITEAAERVQRFGEEVIAKAQ